MRYSFLICAVVLCNAQASAQIYTVEMSDSILTGERTDVQITEIMMPIHSLSDLPLGQVAKYAVSVEGLVDRTNVSQEVEKRSEVVRLDLSQPLPVVQKSTLGPVIAPIIDEVVVPPVIMLPLPR